MPTFTRFIPSGTATRTRPAGIDTRIDALHAAATDLTLASFLRDVSVLAAPMTDLLHHGPSAPVWRPVRAPGRRVSWMDTLMP